MRLLRDLRPIVYSSQTTKKIATNIDVLTFTNRWFFFLQNEMIAEGFRFNGKPERDSSILAASKIDAK